MAELRALPRELWIVERLHHTVEHTPGLHQTAVGFASVGIAATGVLVAAGALVLGIRQGRKAAALGTLAAAVAAYAIAHLLKGAIHRISPETLDPSHHAFPEGPGALTSALAVGLAPRAPRLAAFAAAMTVLDGVSQVALGYHWPSDVLAAWVIGGACALAARRALAAPASAAERGAIRRDDDTGAQPE